VRINVVIEVPRKIIATGETFPEKDFLGLKFIAFLNFQNNPARDEQLLGAITPEEA
jgi:hypothetical protein